MVLATICKNALGALGAVCGGRGPWCLAWTPNGPRTCPDGDDVAGSRDRGWSCGFDSLGAS